jgi:CBS domain-containing protein
MKVREIMVHPVIVVKEDTTLEEIAHILQNEGFK